MRKIKLPHHRAPENLIRAAEARAAKRGTDAYPCIVCGVPAPNPKWHVHVIEGGGQALHPADETAYVADGGDMGLYPVGPECVKRHPELKPYLHKK